MSTKFFLLWLEAPLQSWGADSKFGRRDTLDFPTKSGVLGLLCCALGASGEQRDLLQSMSRLRQTVVSYVMESKHAEHGKDHKDRVEREPHMMDFQMVGAGYVSNDPWQNLLIPKKIDGKSPVGNGTKMTYRYFLQDAHFAVILEIPTEEEESFSYALTNPTYDLYLGRKCCAPTDFIFRGTFDSEGDGIAEANTIAREKGLVEDFRVEDREHPDGDTFAVNDVPVQFGECKKYKDRFVAVIKGP
jgi:CRISPR system Cascade subunit CasD